MSVDRAKLRRFLFGESKAKRTGQTSSSSRLSGAHPARFLSLGLVAMVVIGFIGGIHNLVTSATTEPAVAVAAPDPEPTVDLGAGGFAELYVTTWLSVTRDNTRALAAFYGDSGSVDVPATTTNRFVATRTTVVDEKTVAPDYWAITVATDVSVADEHGQTKPVGLRYYAVGVLRDGGALVATALPAQVPAPPTAKATALAVDSLGSPSADDRPVTDALTGFFRALLIGNGELDRYIAPGSRIAPIRPAPFTEITIRGLGVEPTDAPDKRLVRVELLAANQDRTVTQTLHYSLAIARRDNRWEVAELLPAAPLATKRSPR